MVINFTSDFITNTIPSRFNEFLRYFVLTKKNKNVEQCAICAADGYIRYKAYRQAIRFDVTSVTYV